MIAVPFQQFRHTYPTGRLTTELLLLQDGVYIVRASLADGDAPIVTAMAASDNLDQAEQHAQAKALALMGFTQQSVAPAPDPEPVTSTAATTTVRPAIADPPTKVQVSEPMVTAPVNPVTPLKLAESPLPDSKPPTASLTVPPPATRAAPTTADPSVPMPVAALEIADLEEDVPLAPPSIDAPNPEMLEEMSRPISDIPDIPALEVPVSELAVPNTPTTETAAAFVPDLGAFDSASTDLSDVIAQTDVEMRRLGWTSRQGREHLEHTYGKRSRQQLTDEELLEFLLYLESRPNTAP